MRLLGVMGDRPLFLFPWTFSLAVLPPFPCGLSDLEKETNIMYFSFNIIYRNTNVNLSENRLTLLFLPFGFGWWRFPVEASPTFHDSGGVLACDRTMLMYLQIAARFFVTLMLRA